ncbi:cupin domain-containing protein [Aestuariivita sp.]|jgi:quercetin dioxygenase-like cupin family protein|uniref:(R)-mandelonitrile lyase n=1 Tax=Aestuariivita sp. TaxID=1872407 RepID=UPI00216DE195|nr:cupin domain-containing protein [Aestuariivita sp.]MCE8008136.1 cupin domain-containing protein [Aestuariivita sp.]
MEIFPAGRDTKPVPAEWFTGTVWQDPIWDAPDPARMRALKVTFAPGARTAWHTHPLGQTLYVVSGVGRIGLRSGEVQVIREGDTVWIPPGEEHWHGASPDTMMSHIAIQEAENGVAAVWMEHVTDSDYLQTPA